MFQSSHLLAFFAACVSHTRITPILRSNPPLGGGPSIAFWERNYNRWREQRFFGARGKDEGWGEVEKEVDVLRSRLIIYSRVRCAKKFSDADMYRVRSDYFLPLAPISRTNLRNRRKRGAAGTDPFSPSIGINCSWAGTSLFRPRAPIALILLVAAIRRGSLRRSMA